MKTCILRPVADNSPNDFTPFGGSGSHASRINETTPSNAEGVRQDSSGVTEAFTLSDVPDDFIAALSGRIYFFHKTVGTFTDADSTQMWADATLASMLLHAPLTASVRVTNGGSDFTASYAIDFASRNALTKDQANSLILSFGYGGTLPPGGEWSVYAVWVELDYTDQNDELYYGRGSSLVRASAQGESRINDHEQRSSPIVASVVVSPDE